MDRAPATSSPTWNHDALEEGLGGARRLSVDVADRFARSGWEQLAQLSLVPKRRWRTHHPLAGGPLIALVGGRAAFDVSAWARCVSLIPGAVAIPGRTALEFGIQRSLLRPPAGAPGRMRDLLRTRRRRASMRRAASRLPTAMARRDHAIATRVESALAPGADGTAFEELPAYALAARFESLLAPDPTAASAVLVDLENGAAISALVVALQERGATPADATLRAAQLATGGGASLGPHVEALERVAQATGAEQQRLLDAWLAGLHGWHALREQLLEAPPLHLQRELVRAWIEGPASAPRATASSEAQLDPTLDARATAARGLTALRERAARQHALELAALRAVSWTLAARLADDGSLERADDAFDLTVDQLLAVARGGSPVPATPRSLERSPSGAGKDVESASGTLHGSPASAGVVRGPVLVLDDPGTPQDLDGMILVCRSTDPGWMPLLLRCAGLVTERGGPLSHGAIVARELGIPAVVGASGARAAARSHTHATVDGNTGVVVFSRSS
jgi:pyruvate,water dikinase